MTDIISNNTIISNENLDKLIIPQLKDLCIENNITGYSKNKKELIEHISNKDKLTNINEEYKVKMLKERKINNKGERDEILCKKKIFTYNYNKEYNELEKIFGTSEDIIFIDLKTGKEIYNIEELSKAGPNYKADCKIKFIKTGYITCISIKSKNCGSPSIMNHTHRSAKVFQKDGDLFQYLPSIDLILAEYKDKRNNKIIGQDISINQLDSLKDGSVREDFLKVLVYFVFNGSGKGDSKCKADAIMTYHDKEITFTKCDTLDKKKSYIESIYDRISLSLRNKGMPKLVTDYCKPWIFNDIKTNGSTKYKGSLHIRMKCV